MSRTLGIDPLTAYLATSPGGMDSVAIIAAASDRVDISFVMALQTARFLIVLRRRARRWRGCLPAASASETRRCRRAYIQARVCAKQGFARQPAARWRCLGLAAS